jgi:hypothetical protein
MTLLQRDRTKKSYVSRGGGEKKCVDWVDIVVNVDHADPRGLLVRTSLLCAVLSVCVKMRVSVRKAEHFGLIAPRPQGCL